MNTELTYTREIGINSLRHNPKYNHIAVDPCGTAYLYVDLPVWNPISSGNGSNDGEWDYDGHCDELMINFTGILNDEAEASLVSRSDIPELPSTTDDNLIGKETQSVIIKHRTKEGITTTYSSTGIGSMAIEDHKLLIKQRKEETKRLEAMTRRWTKYNTKFFIPLGVE